jgi:hypothetical protein
MTKFETAKKIMQAHPDLTQKELMAAMKKRRQPCSPALAGKARKAVRDDQQSNGAHEEPEPQPKQRARRKPRTIRRPTGGAEKITAADLMLYGQLVEQLGGPARLNRVRKCYEAIKHN